MPARPGKISSRSIPVSASIPSDLVLQIDLLAERWQVKRSYIVKRAVEEYLSKHDVLGYLQEQIKRQNAIDADMPFEEGGDTF